MSKSQIVIITVGIVSVILLFTLPKSIVPNKRASETAARDTSSHTGEATGMEHLHKVEVSEKDKNTIESLRNSFLSVSNKEKKLNFADSLIKTYRRLHRYDSAARYSEIAAELQPDKANWARAADVNVEAFNFAPEAQRQEFNEKARVYFNKILEKNPGDLETKSKLALTYVGGDNPMQGIMILREVLQADPENESAIYNLGILSIQSRQYDKAIKRFEDLLKINPKHSAAQFYLGVAWANAGDKRKATEAFRKAREMDIDPEFRATVDSYLKELGP